MSAYPPTGCCTLPGLTHAATSANSTAELARNCRIAALWDDLTTAGTGDDIYVDSSVSGQVIIRWDATNKANGGDVNFAAVLMADGTIALDYGAGNDGLTPTIGISRGDGQHYLLSDYDGQSTLGDLAPTQFVLAPGRIDLGAVEFLGDSNDVQPPIVAATSPGGVHVGDAIAPLNELRVVFSEPVNVIDGWSTHNFELRSDGGNGIFGDVGDVIYPVVPIITIGSNLVTLDIPDGPLPGGHFRLVVSG